MKLREKFNNFIREYAPGGEFLTTDITRPVTAVGAMGATAVLSGCLAGQAKYMNNPQDSGFLVREVGQTANCLDAAYPRTFKDSGKKIGEGLGDIMIAIPKVGDSLLGFAGLRPFSGRFFGVDAYQPGIFSSNPNSWRHYNYAKFEGRGIKDKAKYTVMHVPNSSFNLFDSVGDLAGGTWDTSTQVVNLVGIVPLTPNTAERDKWVDDNPLGKHNPSNDNTKKVLDAVTFPKDGVRYVMYVLGRPEIFSRAQEDLGQKAKDWAKVSVEEEQRSLVRRNFYDPTDVEDRHNGLKYGISVPAFVVNPATREIHGTVARYDPKTDSLEMVADTVEDSLHTKLVSDEDWYKGLKDPEKQPGIIKDKEFYPNPSNIVSIGKAVGAAAWIYSIVSDLWCDDGENGSKESGEVKGGRKDGSGGAVRVPGVGGGSSGGAGGAIRSVTGEGNSGVSGGRVQ